MPLHESRTENGEPESSQSLFLRVFLPPQCFGTASPALLDGSPTPVQPQAPASIWLCSDLPHFLFSSHSQYLSPSHTYKPPHPPPHPFLSLDDSKDPSISPKRIFSPRPWANMLFSCTRSSYTAGLVRQTGQGQGTHPLSPKQCA